MSGTSLLPESSPDRAVPPPEALPATRPGPRPGRGWDLASAVLLLGFALVMVGTWRDFGVTWDEVIQQEYGEHVLRYYRTLGEDRGAFHYRDTRFYGPAFELLATGFAAVSSLGTYDARHLVNVVAGWLALLAAWRLGRTLGGPRAGFLAVLLLGLTPRFYGHAFNNPKDIPFAAGYAWTVAALAALLPTLPRPAWRRALPAALALGLTLGVRIGGLLLVAYWGAVVALSAGLALRRGTPPWRAAREAAGAFLKVLAPAWVLMVAVWPWVQPAPLTRPFEALRTMNRFPWDGTVLFRGESIAATQLPADYLPVWLGITLPLGLLLLLAVGAVLGAGWVLRRSRRGRAEAPAGWREAGVGLVVFAALFPPAWIVISGATLYDGMRHVLFIVPLLAVLAALALEAALRRVQARRLAGALIGAAVAAHAGWMVFSMARYHPYEALYFNALVGGLPGAAGRFETDYWGISYKEAVALLVRHVEAEGRRPTRRPVRVRGEHGHMSTQYYLPEGYEFTWSPRRADYQLAATRFDAHLQPEGEVIAVVERFGVPLNYVKDLRRGRRGARR